MHVAYERAAFPHFGVLHQARQMTAAARRFLQPLVQLLRLLLARHLPRPPPKKTPSHPPPPGIPPTPQTHLLRDSRAPSSATRPGAAAGPPPPAVSCRCCASSSLAASPAPGPCCAPEGPAWAAPESGREPEAPSWCWCFRMVLGGGAVVGVRAWVGGWLVEALHERGVSTRCVRWRV